METYCIVRQSYPYFKKLFVIRVTQLYPWFSVISVFGANYLMEKRLNLVSIVKSTLKQLMKQILKQTTKK